MATITNFDKRMFEMAREVAETSTYGPFHLGCVIVYKHHVIANAANSQKTHPVQKKYNRRYREFKKGLKPALDMVHAEIAALNCIPYPIAEQIDWKDVKVYVYRISPGHKLGHGMARPCPACFNALKEKGIRHIYYTTNEGFAYERIED